MQDENKEVIKKTVLVILSQYGFYCIARELRMASKV